MRDQNDRKRWGAGEGCALGTLGGLALWLFAGWIVFKFIW